MPDKLIFDVQKSPGKLYVKFSSTMELIDSAAEDVKIFMGSKNLKKYSFGVRVVMREGLTNAVRHGNKSDPDKLVRFSITIVNDILTMIIEDEGDGFDWREIKALTGKRDAVEVPLDHGRGFPIMEEYFDDYDYNNKGNILTIKKMIS